MLLFITLEYAFELIKDPRLLFEDQLIPYKVPPVHNSPYRPGYDWLFHYERKIARKLEPWLKTYRYELIGETGIICEALSNAFCHGHSKDKYLPINIKGYIGEKGLLVQVKDTGKGFNVKHVYEKFSKGKNYFQIAGNGLRHMLTSEDFGIFFSHKGSAFHLLYLFDRKPDEIEGAVETPEQKNNNNNSSESISYTPAPVSLTHSKATVLNKPSSTQIPIQSAVLMDMDMGVHCLAAIGLDHEQLPNIINITRQILESTDTITRHLKTGDTEFLSIRSNKETITISRHMDQSRILFTVILPEANPALTKVYISQTLTYFRENIG